MIKNVELLKITIRIAVGLIIVGLLIAPLYNMIIGTLANAFGYEQSTVTLYPTLTSLLDIRDLLAFIFK